jgi:hypothetical protein
MNPTIVHERRSNMRDLERELDGWDGNWPPSWRPREGETLVGRLVRYGTAPGVYGPVRTAIVERDSGDRLTIWLSSQVLLALFEEQAPQVGERIGLKYAGRHPEKGYHRYALLVDRPEAGPLAFTPLGGERDPEAREDPFAE